MPGISRTFAESGKGTSEILETGRLGRVELLLERSGESHQLEGRVAGTMTRFPKSRHMPRCWNWGLPGSLKELTAMNLAVLG